MYAMLTTRKLMIISQISDLQFQITQLYQNQMDLTSLGGVIGDGTVTQQEFANSGQKTKYGVNQILMEADSASQTSGYSFVQMSTDGMGSMVFDETYLTNIQAQISNSEKQIEMKREQLETKLKALEQELQAVDEGENQGIQMSAPKCA